MYFSDMIWVIVRFAAGGTMFGSARYAAFSAALICVGVCPSSVLRAFTKSMCDEMPFVYAVTAVALSPFLKAASALTNCSCAYVIAGNFVLSEKRYRLGEPAGTMPVYPQKLFGR